MQQATAVVAFTEGNFSVNGVRTRGRQRTNISLRELFILMREITSYKLNDLRREILFWNRQECSNILSTGGKVHAFESPVKAIDHISMGYYTIVYTILCTGESDMEDAFLSVSP